jgi:hypothetical protein
LLERDPVIMKDANSLLILNEGERRTDDKPTVRLATPPDPNGTNAFVNVRVANIRDVFRMVGRAAFLTSRGATDARSAPTSAIQAPI